MMAGYICDYCGSKMQHVAGDLWKCPKMSCSAEGWIVNGRITFDDDFNKNGLGYVEVYTNYDDEQDDED